MTHDHAASFRVDQNAVSRWAGLRLAVCVLVATVLSAMLWSAFFLVHVFDTRTQHRLVMHQTQEADLWARMLNARVESHLRLLTSIAEGMHTSLLDKPAVLDGLLQQEGSMMRLFESLHVALPSGTVSHHAAVGHAADVDAAGMDVLRRTIAEGKPMLSHVQTDTDSQHLHVLLSVPMRQVDGHVTGALAATVRLPLAALMPEVAAPQSALQYLLLDSEGWVLVHSDVTQRWKNIRELVGVYGGDWRSLSSPLAANADSQIWGTVLATRVGLPLPRWQAVILRDMAQDMALNQGLPMRVWVALGVGALLLIVGAVAVLWGWLAPWPTARPLAESLHARTLVPGVSESALPEEAVPPELGQRQSLHSEVSAMLEAVPSAMLLEQEGRVSLVTPQVAVLLGYFVPDAEFPSLAQLLDSPADLFTVRQALVEMGSFEGLLRLRKKDGDWVTVQAAVWVPSPLSSATAWRLSLPWTRRRSMPLPDAEHVWRDALTGLPNRAAFVWGLQSWVTDSMQAPKVQGAETRVPSQGCVLFADLDHLGMLNEVTSRDMGNNVLRHVGHMIAHYTQPLGSVARLGGDEFAVLLPGVSLAHAQAIGQALCDAVWRWQPSWGGERHWVSISVGVVAVNALRHTVEQALHAADMACYEAKRRGRCQVAVGQISASRSLEA